MRVLVLCSDTGVRVGDGKGAALHLLAITSAFAALGHDVEVVGVAANPDGPLEAWPVPCHLVDHPGRAEGELRERRKRETVESVAELALSVCARLQPDVVYERLSLFGTAGTRVAAVTGAVHVLEVNALLAAEEARWRGLVAGDLAAAVEDEVLRSADLRVAVSEEVAGAVRAVAPGPTEVVPNGFDARLFSGTPDRVAARAELGLAHDGPLLCFTGSLRAWHGLDIAVEALPLLPDAVHLVVAGDGPVRDGLTSRSAELGVADRVHWLGQVQHASIPTVLAASDVALAPYPPLADFAFSPLKLYEYLAAGTPVVASAIGQLPEALGHGRWGRLVTPGDPAALADGIRDVLADPVGSLARAEMARDYAHAEHAWESRASDIVHAVSALRVEADRALPR
ncbi:glycosyltransferase family 4 protein [Terrabacter terrigena]|uniref:Glycosyltransferase family 4 protein n=1 Tax=Terrabacter terrigena TaxID=574718 RepID=A0ABW3N3U9_9MICO